MPYIPDPTKIQVTCFVITPMNTINQPKQITIFPIISYVRFPHKSDMYPEIKGKTILG